MKKGYHCVALYIYRASAVSPNRASADHSPVLRITLSESVSVLTSKQENTFYPTRRERPTSSTLFIYTWSLREWDILSIVWVSRCLEFRRLISAYGRIFTSSVAYYHYRWTDTIETILHNAIQRGLDDVSPFGSDLRQHELLLTEPYFSEEKIILD